jgi:hypothetical protein
LTGRSPTSHLNTTHPQEQFEAAALCAAPASSLFRGVSIHVNGLTRPSHAELKVLMARHGGRFETYYSRDRVTHIVCAHLPDTKLKQLAHARCVWTGGGGVVGRCGVVGWAALHKDAP